MPDLTNISFHEVIVYFILLVRIATMVVTVPFLGFEAVPAQVKAAISFLLTLLLYSVIDKSQLKIPLDMLPFIIMIINEVLIGLVIGFVMGILFAGVRMAGTLIGLDMGFAIVNVLDPQSGEQVSIISQFKYIVALLLFVSFDGHHFVLRILKLSYESSPITGDNFSPAVISEILTMSGKIFIIGLKLAATALAALFLTSVVMGFLARMVPQMNIFIVGFPLKISVGFIMLIISMPFFLYMFEKLYHIFQRDVIRIMQIV